MLLAAARRFTRRRPRPRADAAGPPRGGQGAVVRGVGGDGGWGAGKGHRPRGGRIVPLPAGGSMEALSCAQPHGDDPHGAATARTEERIDVRHRPDEPRPRALGRTAVSGRPSFTLTASSGASDTLPVTPRSGRSGTPSPPCRDRPDRAGSAAPDGCALHVGSRGGP